jgi:hypothetical protein
MQSRLFFILSISPPAKLISVKFPFKLPPVTTYIRINVSISITYIANKAFRLFSNAWLIWIIRIKTRYSMDHLNLLVLNYFRNRLANNALIHFMLYTLNDSIHSVSGLNMKISVLMKSFILCFEEGDTLSRIHDLKIPLN